MNAFKHSLAAVIGSALFLAAPLVPADTGSAVAAVNKCVAADGSTIYTDGTCNGGSRAAPLSNATLAVLRTDPVFAEQEVRADESFARAAPLPVHRGCARNVAQLQRNLVFASVRKDINALSASYHWVDLTEKDAPRIFKQLDRMTRHPLTDAVYIGSMTDALAAGDAAQTVGQLALQSHGGGVPSMQMVAYKGCYFARF